MGHRPTILFSLAHPDDESFMVAGVSCKYGARGVRLVLATATLGDAGKVGDPSCLFERRTAPGERKASCAGRWIYWASMLSTCWDTGTRSLCNADPARIRGQLVRLLRRYRPAVVITFDPNGFNQHPDHIAISRFTSDAIAAAADPRWLPEAGKPHRVTRLLWTPPLRPEEIGAGPPLGNRPGRRFPGRHPGLVGPQGRGLESPPHPAPLHQSNLVRSSRSGTGALERTLPPGLGAAAGVEA